MKRIRLILLSFAFILGSLSSCDDKLDINTDPLVATSADPNAVLPYVFVQYSSRKVTELGTRICDVPQYISDTFNSPKNGRTSIFLTGNTWGMMYNQVLGNLSLVKADAAAAGPTSNNVNAIATIISAHIFYELTSIWEDVPFTEALNGQEFPFPNFDDQQTILNGVVAMYDEAIALIDSTPSSGVFAITPAGDQWYGGDMASWRILANSLKLRALMLLRNGGANVDAQINATLSQPLMTSNGQAAYLRYSGQPGAQNGMLTIITAFFGPDNESQNVFGPGDPIDALLRDSGDPRYDLWVARNDLPAPGIDLFPDNTTSVLSNNIIRADLPDMVMLPAEIDLYKAELALEGVTAAGNAETNYRNGVRNSITWWGQDIPGVITTVSTADIDAYVNSLPAPTLEDVYNQQYLAAFLQPVLSWNHVRRNQFPVLETPPASNISTILKRFNYPPDEVGANPNTPANPETDVPMWFENL
ncbi:SusD/RagB family nutrient-binding outer membrane lipoprotein [Lentiprolixibacter aurantiacus]|uniref:SusD/RagB family nutrient-binding outer membrane lipoprotein n=1 Tax=Lentiprolixibacter aurantiacus TaxID=2993939 RepID=A0AAE3SQR4_9FLAO|nr:SusD/RagB family nutrient-binding outer membrane lipoprotein [Lentiprolixibacter aurantiacus]MCX2720692.1 SusD/RagB family nutrient-binding outer membrane lipoprotein [Lentiprolixibacter aurantiacus]